MGFFTRSKIATGSCDHRHRPHQQARRKYSFTDPPNVYLPPAPPGPPSSHPYQQHNYSQPAFKPVGYLPAPPALDWTAPPGMLMNSGANTMQQMACGTSTMWTDAIGGIAKTVSAYDDISKCLNDVMTMIDCECLKGNETKLFSCAPTSTQSRRERSRDRSRDRHRETRRQPRRSKSVDDAEERALFRPSKKDRDAEVNKDHSREKKSSSKASKEKLADKNKVQPANVAASVVAGTYFSKVECYANSSLPADLPPLSVYTTTWRLLCLAAQFSQSVYERPRGPEREAHVPSDWRTGTKAMRIKSVPMDSMDTIVFAIRGTASFMDWAVNLNSSPVSPQGFLDDPGNLCHQGFLSTARSMVAPVAKRLADLLEENPDRSRYSLMITGHSAGGAVAALLYCHMLSRTTEARSELNAMTDRFKRVHCVTFGSPPVSLLPLLKPNRPSLKKSIFMSFVNEGDPVVRAEKPYVKSLLELLASPVPTAPEPRTRSSDEKHGERRKTPTTESKGRSKTDDNRLITSRPPHPSKPTWRVPEATLSNAGRLIILRSGTPNARPKDRKTVGERLDEGVVAVTCEEEQLRGCVFGDPVAHMMALYAGRIEVLAVGAVTGKFG
ncbi:hypothetical protein NLU13_8003 [Sarocladium strictum]|uniref:Fungal lipase-type domain-containing protein n=1 Tax=Sarocladium strictum TaxID=5046 RepID=A0AA39L4K0_SARSR|nr:hypothetical protein NLU13_8003 [Sarocladium strictum]